MNSVEPEGCPPCPEAPGSALPWSRLAGKVIIDAYAHDVEPEAGGGTLFWYDCADGTSVPIFSAKDDQIAADPIRPRLFAPRGGTPKSRGT